MRSALVRTRPQVFFHDTENGRALPCRVCDSRHLERFLISDHNRVGTPVKGKTLLNTVGIGPDIVDCLVERNPLRRGLYSPGKHIPIHLETELECRPDVYLVLAWNFKDEILRRYSELIEGGVEFYFPVESTC